MGKAYQVTRTYRASFPLHQTTCLFPVPVCRIGRLWDVATGYTAAPGAAASIILFFKVGLKRGMKYRWGAVWIARYSEAFRDGGWWLVLPK